MYFHDPNSFAAKLHGPAGIVQKRQEVFWLWGHLVGGLVSGTSAGVLELHSSHPHPKDIGCGERQEENKSIKPVEQAAMAREYGT